MKVFQQVLQIVFFLKVARIFIAGYEEGNRDDDPERCVDPRHDVVV